MLSMLSIASRRCLANALASVQHTALVCAVAVPTKEDA
jgi:hypothetical protein